MASSVTEPMYVMMRTQLKSGSVRDGSGKDGIPLPGGGPRSGMGRILALIRRIALLTGLLALTVLLVWAFDSRSMPELQIWHTVSLSHEFTARDETPRSTLKDYLDREERLFRELKEKVYDRLEPTDELAFSRYLTGGPQDPRHLPRNWNRTFELVPKNIRGGALLLHGLTDSPYSLRRIGEILYARGFYVLGLRLPAHGTIPGALTKVHWEDWMAASRIGAIHVRERIGPKRPFVVCGYSNGGALAVNYSLDALVDASLPRPDRLLLFSPEIGIMKIALVANAHKLFSFLPYFAQAKWQSIEPEFDPYKYNSFSMNAAQQAYDLTIALQRQVEAMRRAGRFADFPPTLAFLSWIDATVETSATINRLFDRLENEGSELVIFDVNRSNRLAPFLKAANRAPLERIFARSDLPYRLTIITNVAGNSEGVAKRTKAPRSSAVDSTDLGMAWPRGVYSLSHVAIPFAPDDPVYGAGENAGVAYGGLPLGRLQARGETHLLIAPISRLMRLRYNPFFEYMAQRVIEEIDDISSGSRRK
jgi:alpha-beta hydrolase superfamily lysophospholipase